MWGFPVHFHTIFWMKDMIPLRCHNGNQYTPSQIARLRNRVKRNMRAYHAFIQAGVVAQGLLQYLAVAALPSLFGVLRVLAAHHSSRHPALGVVVAKALAPDTSRILMGPAKSDSLTKFIAERQDMQNMPLFRWLRNKNRDS